MKKHITYLVSFLCIFGLSISQDTKIYKATNYEVSYIIDYSTTFEKDAFLFTYFTQIAPLQQLLITNNIIVDLLSDNYSEYVFYILKLQNRNYQKISQTLAENTFLVEQNTSNSPNNRLY